MGDALEQCDGIFTGEVGVAGIVVDPEIRMFDRLDELAEDVHLLGEFGIFPKVVLVVVLDDEEIEALVKGESVRGYSADEYQQMSVKELRKKLIDIDVMPFEGAFLRNSLVHTMKKAATVCCR